MIQFFCTEFSFVSKKTFRINLGQSMKKTGRRIRILLPVLRCGFMIDYSHSMVADGFGDIS